MLCSECNKNPAILFYKKIENGNETMEGFCADCAKKKGINPAEALAGQSNFIGQNPVNLGNMSQQFESIFKDLAQNINLDDIENIEGAITFGTQDMDGDEEVPKISGAAIPLGSIFSNIFPGRQNDQDETSSNRKKVKVEKKINKKTNKKKKFLET